MFIKLNVIQEDIQEAYINKDHIIFFKKALSEATIKKGAKSYIVFNHPKKKYDDNIEIPAHFYVTETPEEIMEKIDPNPLKDYFKQPHEECS